MFVEYLSETACSVRFPYKDGTPSEPRIVSARRVGRDLTLSITQSGFFALR